MRRIALSFALVSLLATSGCGGFIIQAPRVAPGATSLLHSGHVASVEVGILAEMNADKVEMLMAYDVPGAMSNALSGLGSPGTPYHVNIFISQFRNGFGPARLHTQITVSDPSGAVVHAFETDSTTIRGGSRSKRLQIIVQDGVDQIAAGL